MRASLLALVLFASSTAAQADPVLQSILAQSAKAPVVGFERTIRAELRANPKKDPGIVVERFIPRDARSGSWTLVSIDGRKPTEKELEAHRKATASGVIPGFHRLHEILGTAPTRRTEVGGKTVYFWSSLSKGAVVSPGGDISDKLSAEATVEQIGGKPNISRFRIFAVKPFKVGGIATMNAFDVISQYRPGGNGFPFLEAQSQSSDATAPFGLGGKRVSQVSFKPI